ncbi:hypothetical protein LTR08_001284 [Meristemomyces frigidus]|nr:hypothetical protein LTR08_001284 [Meristemomyces frigidus]
MTSITDTLPPELLARVFSYLSGSCNDIATCRLVCYAFRELSSPFLITQVVFATRHKTIKKLREVAEHPYFRRYVTNLVWDASFFSPSIALDWERYSAECAESLDEDSPGAELISSPLEELQCNLIEQFADGGSVGATTNMASLEATGPAVFPAAISPSREYLSFDEQAALE